MDKGWLLARYPTMTDVHELCDAYEREFGWRPTERSVYAAAHAAGVAKARVGRVGSTERPVRWSREPEMCAWMAEHDHGQRMDLLSEDFHTAFGFGLSRGQISAWRAMAGTSERRHWHGGARSVPVGTERTYKDGYTVVKVAERPERPMSRDNWKLKHVWVYEQAHGPLPEGHMVYFADGDKSNFDVSNLVAVPRELCALLVLPGAPRWHDAESLEACVALARMRSKVREVEFAAPRRCGVCGRTFSTPDARGLGPEPPQTCPECLAAGHKSRGAREYSWRREDVLRLAREGLQPAEVAARVGCTERTAERLIGESREREADDGEG